MRGVIAAKQTQLVFAVMLFITNLVLTRLSMLMIEVAEAVDPSLHELHDQNPIPAVQFWLNLPVSYVVILITQGFNHIGIKQLAMYRSVILTAISPFWGYLFACALAKAAVYLFSRGRDRGQRQ